MFNKITDIFNENCETNFEALALEVFRYQYSANKVYQTWVSGFVSDVYEVTHINQIPFLPIEFFKTHEVVCAGNSTYDAVFTSSTTTSQTPSQHFVKDVSVYEQSFFNGFEQFFGTPNDYCFLALLPGYIERSGSSLVYMCEQLIKKSTHPLSGFYLRNLDELTHVIKTLKVNEQKTILIGVSYALLDLAEKNIELSDCFTVIETGGMKGTRKEMLKEELHSELKRKFKLDKISSEYGMTELLSQAYAVQDGLFESPAWMRFLIRDINDPLSYMQTNKTGGINVIDLANVHSCSFIATKDLGQLNESGQLKLMGRYDNSDIRGCNLMVG